MARTLSQADRPLQTGVSPLGPDDLVPVSLVGEEALSEPFSFTVDFLSMNGSIQASALLGKPMSIRIAIGKERYVHGIVRRFAGRGKVRDFHQYRAELVPAMLMLSRGNDCRTFEEKTAVEIVESVLKEKGAVTDLQLKVTGTLKKIPFCVQYRETNLDFIGRMLAEAGLYYYHTHEKSKHTMVITDAHGGAIPAGALAEVRWGGATNDDVTIPDTIVELSRDAGVVSASISYRDHDLLRADSVGSASSTKPGAVGERYDFLGTLGPNESAALAKLAIEAEEAAHDLLEGSSTCATFEPGSRVKLTGGMLGAGGQEVLVVRVGHRASSGDVAGGAGGDADYQNTFEAIPASTRYRPDEDDEPEPMHGAQVAKIVGSGSAGDIDVDKDGRVLLQFPWDRGAGKDGKSKHRVHVASVWAGTGWGFVQHPRLGQEVLVDFVEGDPNRPIVVGSVYNSTHKYPYALPDHKTQSGIKTRSVGGGDANFNELRFEDKKGSEHIHLHAERDLHVEVEANETRSVGSNRSTTIGNDDTWHVKHSREGTVDVNQSLTVGGDVTEDVGGDKTVTIGGDDSLSVGGKQDVTISGKRSVDVAEDEALTIGKNMKASVAKKLAIEAGDEVTITCGQSSISLKKDGTLTVKGVKLVLEGQASIDLKAAKATIKATAQAEIQGAMVKLKADAMAKIEAAIADLGGSGLLKTKGGIAMHN